MMRLRPTLMALSLAIPLVAADTPRSVPSPLPPLREQDRIRQEWLRHRLERVLPTLMRRHGVSMWLVICREYNEDPVFFSLVSPSVMAARRRTILVFYDQGPEKGSSGWPWAAAATAGSTGSTATRRSKDREL